MPQGVYKILSASEGRTYQGKHGDLVVWNVTLENCQPENGAASFELHKKPGNVPEVGDTVEVDRFAPGEFNGTPHVRIFAASNFQGGGGSSSGGGGGGSTGQKTYGRQPDHPLNMARAVHNGALSSVTDVIEQRLTLNIEPAPTNDAEYWAMYGRVYKKLRDSYPEGVLAQAGFVNGAVGAAVSQPQEVPVDTTDLTPAPAPASATDQSIPF